AVDDDEVAARLRSGGALARALGGAQPLEVEPARDDVLAAAGRPAHRATGARARRGEHLLDPRARGAGGRELHVVAEARGVPFAELRDAQLEARGRGAL